MALAGFDGVVVNLRDDVLGQDPEVLVILPA